MDQWLMTQLNQLAGWGYWTDYAAFFLARYGNLLVALFLVLCWFVPREQRLVQRRTVVLAVMSAIFALGLAQIPGAIYYRERPFRFVPGTFDLLGTSPSGTALVFRWLERNLVPAVDQVLESLGTSDDD